jgi:RNA recognition motif-containing protein
MSATIHGNSVNYGGPYYGGVLPQPTLAPVSPPFHVPITHAPYPVPVHYGTYHPPYYHPPHPPISPSYPIISLPNHPLYNQPPSPTIFRNGMPPIVPIYLHMIAANIQHISHRYPHPPGIPPPLPASATLSSWNPPIPPKPLPVLPSSSSLPVVPQTVPRLPPRKPNATHSSGRRSHWVMWIGNVPSDATESELWQVFSRPPTPQSSSSPTEKSGLISIHVLAKSNCAFANYESEPYLNIAIAGFDGRSCRPRDLRCPPLVCRTRRMDEDVKRGAKAPNGMHLDWTRKQHQRTGGSASNSRQDPGITTPTEEQDVDDASSSSSFLNRHFTSRYFVLKSLTEVSRPAFSMHRTANFPLNQADLNISVEKGIWATQRHNEETLDRAYRTSENVFLIFGANKSREFFGYARFGKSQYYIYTNLLMAVKYSE